MVVGVIERAVGSARVVFTDRHGGVARAPYASANLADHVGDEPAAVTANRERVAAALEIGEPPRWAEVRQVHGNAVLRVGPPDDDATSGPRADADALVTRAS